MRQGRHGGLGSGSPAQRGADGDRCRRPGEGAEPAGIPPALVELAYYLRAIRYGRGGAAERAERSAGSSANPPE